MATYAGRYSEDLQDRYGNGFRNAKVAAQTLLGAAVTLYADRDKTAYVPAAGLAANEIKADSRGNLRFFADPGNYQIVVTPSGGSTLPAFPVSVLPDPLEPDASEGALAAEQEAREDADTALSQAIAAVDSGALHKATDEAVTGVKDFTEPFRVGRFTWAAVQAKVALEGALARVTDRFRGLALRGQMGWYSLNAQKVYVDEFTTGDGTADETAGVSAAVEAAAAEPGLTRLVFSDRTYLLDSLLVRSNVWYDLGGATLKKRVDGSSAPGSQPINSMMRAIETLTGATYYGTYSNIKITGGTFDPNGKTCPSNILRLTFVERLVIGGVTVLHNAAFDGTYRPWAMQLGGRRGSVTHCTILGGNEVFEDGIHISHGQYWRIANNHVESGDDGIVLGNEPTDPYASVDPDPIRHVAIANNTVIAEKGAGLAIYVQSGALGALWEVSDVVVNGLTGKAGITRNGGLKLMDYNNGAAGTSQIKRIKISNVDLEVGSAVHDDVNGIGVNIQSVSDLSLDNVSMPITEQTGAAGGFDLCRVRNSEDVSVNRLMCNALQKRFGFDARTSRRVSLTSSKLRMGTGSLAPVYLQDVVDAKIVGNDLLDIKNGISAVQITAGTTTSGIVARNTARKLAGAISAKGLTASPGTYSRLQVEGNDFTGVDVPYDPSSFRGDFSVLFSGRAGLLAATAQTTTLSENGNGLPSGSVGAFAAFYVDPSEWAAGRTAQLKMRGVLIGNAVAPGSDFTVGLYPVTGSGSGGAGALPITIGAVVAGSTVAFVAPAVGAALTGVSTEFTAPAAGIYVICVVVSANMAANSAVMVRGQLLGRAV